MCASQPELWKLSFGPQFLPPPHPSTLPPQGLQGMSHVAVSADVASSELKRKLEDVAVAVKQAQAQSQVSEDRGHGGLAARSELRHTCLPHLVTQTHMLPA